MPRSVQYVYRSQNLLKLNMQCQRTIPKENTKNKPPSLTFFKIPRTWSFHVVVLQRTATKCTKNYNARAQVLFCSLNRLFCGVLVAVAVVVCLRSLIAPVPCSVSINKSSVRILLVQNRVMADAQVPVQAAVPAAQALVPPPAAPANVDNPQQDPAPLQVLISFLLFARSTALVFPRFLFALLFHVAVC